LSIPKSYIFIKQRNHTRTLFKIIVFVIRYVMVFLMVVVNFYYGG